MISFVIVVSHDVFLVCLSHDNCFVYLDLGLMSFDMVAGVVGNLD